MKGHGWRGFVAGAVAGMLLAAGSAGYARAGRRLTQGQARRLARLVARHEHIDVSSPWTEFDPMDVGTPYLAGFWSFAVVREAQKPGPDTMLRRYAVNRATGDVWEMTLCRRYDFAALTRLRKKLTGRAEPGAAAVVAERKDLGCEARGPGQERGRTPAGSR